MYQVYTVISTRFIRYLQGLDMYQVYTMISTLVRYTLVYVPGLYNDIYQVYIISTGLTR